MRNDTNRSKEVRVYFVDKSHCHIISPQWCGQAQVVVRQNILGTANDLSYCNRRLGSLTYYDITVLWAGVLISSDKSPATWRACGVGHDVRFIEKVKLQFDKTHIVHQINSAFPSYLYRHLYTVLYLVWYYSEWVPQRDWLVKNLCFEFYATIIYQKEKPLNIQSATT